LKKNIIFGSSGLIGLSFYTLFKNNKKYIFYSNTDKRFKRFNLNLSLKKFPVKEVDICYFFASPRILKKNFKNNNFRKEFNWLKNIITNIKIRKLIYISSSSIYYQKDHIIGSIKKKCEKYIIENRNFFSNYQIWRPFNLIGKNYVQSDHFHNLLFKQMFINKKKKFSFSGNLLDKRGYSDVNDFSKVLNKYSKKNISFIKNYGNKDLVCISEIIDLYNVYYEKINGRKFESEFKSKKININSVRSKKNAVFYNKKSLLIFKKYLNKSINEKKVQHL